MNPQFVFVFVLAHFLGDFVFQTNTIAKIKSESVRGVLIHCSVVGLVQVLLLAPFGMEGIVPALISGSLHFLIDLVKLYTGKWLIRFTLLYFLVDQGVHIGIIFWLGSIWNPSFLMSPSLLSLACGFFILIVATFIATIMCKMLVRDLFDEVRELPFFMKGERQVDSLFSLLFWIGFFFLPKWSPWALLILLILPYHKMIKKKFPYDTKHVIWKLGFYALLAWAGTTLWGVIAVSLLPQ